MTYKPLIPTALLTLVLLTIAACGPEVIICPGDDPTLHTGRTPTSLKDDCRCTAPTSVDYPFRCLDLENAIKQQPQLGEGPSLYMMADERIGAGQPLNGELWEDRGEVILAVSMGSNKPGFVMGLDVETGNRRVISGWYLTENDGEVSVGDGPLWGEPYWAKRGPDGMIYVLTKGYPFNADDYDSTVSYYMIWKVNPDTGARTLHWQHNEADQGFGQCSDGNSTHVLGHAIEPGAMGIYPDAFEITEDGAMLLSTSNLAGMMEISPDAKSCRIVTLRKASAKTNDYYDEGVGSGFDLSPQIYSIAEINGKLLVTDHENVIEVDRQTGKRTRLYKELFPGQLEFDAKRNVYHVTAVPEPYKGIYYVIDAASGESYNSSSCLNVDKGHPVAELCIRIGGGPNNAHNNRNQGWLLPDEEHMIIVSGLHFNKLDLNTGVVNHFSY